MDARTVTPTQPASDFANAAILKNRDALVAPAFGFLAIKNVTSNASENQLGMRFQ